MITGALVGSRRCSTKCLSPTVKFAASWRNKQHSPPEHPKMVMTPASQGLDGGQCSTLTRKLSKLLGGTTRPQASSNIEQSDHASVLESLLPNSATSSQRIPLFRWTKSFSTNTIPSSDAASLRDVHSETNQSSSSLMKGSRSHGSSIYPKPNAASTSRTSGRISSSSRSHRAPSRSSTMSKFKYSSPRSPPSVYASFAHEGPTKKSRPLVLNPQKQPPRSKDKAKSSKKYQPSVVGTSPLPSPASPSATQSSHLSITSSTPFAIGVGTRTPKTEVADPARDEFMDNSSLVASDKSQIETDGGQLASSSDAIIDPHSIPSTDTLPNTSDTPGFSEHELRRRKVQKLYRTLGESVPLELVFRDTDQNKKSELEGRGKSKDDSEIAGPPNVEWQTSGKQTHSPLSTKPASQELSDHPSDSESSTTPSGVANQPPDVTKDEMPPASPIQCHPQIVISVCCSEECESVKPVHEEGQWLTRRPKLLTHSGSLRTQTPSTSAASCSSPVTLTDKSQIEPFIHHSRGKSEQAVFADTTPRSNLIFRSSSLTRLRTPNSQPTSPLSAAPFAPYIEGSKLLSSPTPAVAESSAVQRKERKEGWSGEWNQDDMQDVIRKLRMLK